MSERTGAHFFVSYTGADKDWAVWIAWQLEQAGHQTTIQAWDFRPGHNFVLAMQQATIRADCTIAVISPEFFASGFTSPEWAAAFAKDPTGADRRLIPVRVRTGDPPGLLGQLVYTDLVGLNENDAREALLYGVQAGRAKPATAPSFPGSPPPAFPGHASANTLQPSSGAPQPAGISTTSLITERCEGQIVVGELPGRPPVFVKRDAAGRLAKAFADGGGVAAVSSLTGGRGSGKTQVAAQYARQAVAEGVGLVAWVSAEDRVRMLSDLGEVARRMGVEDPDGDSEVSAKRLRDALASRIDPAVMVFDNAIDPKLVEAYLPGAGAVRVIITSTHQAFASFGTSILVDRFDREQSLAYLNQRTQLADDEGADELANELDDLPLALAQAASVINLQGLTYGVYLERLHALPLQEMLPPDSAGYPHGVARAVLLSVEGIEAADPSGLTARVLNSAGLLDPSGTSRDLLAALVNSPDQQTLDRALGRLVEASLLVWTDDRRGIIMHRLIARSIRDRLQTRGQLASTIKTTAEDVRKLLPGEQEAWSQRETAAELVAHATSVWQHAVEAAQKEALTPEELRSLAPFAHWTVSHLRATADLSRAIETGASVLTDIQAALAVEHPQALAARNNLANAYQEAGQLDQAIPLYEQTLATCERVLGPDHPDTLASRNNLASAHREAGQLDQAFALHQDTLAARERVLGPDHPHTLTSRNNLANAYQATGKHDQAFALHQDTLAVRERVLGPDHPHTLTSRNNLANAYQATGKHDQAIALHQDTLAVRERVLGPDHPHTLDSRNNLANAYQEAGQLDQAIPLYQDTLAARERVLGPDHPDTLACRNNLASAYRVAGQLDQAIALHQDTLAVRERVLGPDHPHTLDSRNNLANAYQEAGQLDQAIALHQDTLAVRERVLGPDHPHTLDSRNNLANAYQAAGKHDQAIPLHEQTLAAFERVLGPDHPHTLTSRNNLANARRAGTKPD